MWGVEVSSGHGPREVRTCLQLSDRPLVDHIILETGDLYAPLQIIHVIQFKVSHPSEAQMTYVVLSTVLFVESPNETINGDNEDPAFFSTMVCCSLVSFA